MAQDWQWAGDDNKTLAKEVYGDKWEDDLEKLLNERWGEDWAADPKKQDAAALGNLLYMQALPFAEEVLQKEAEKAFSKLDEELQKALGDLSITTDATPEEVGKKLVDAIKADPTGSGEDPEKAVAEIKAAVEKAESAAKSELEAIIAEQEKLMAALTELGKSVGGGD